MSKQVTTIDDLTGIVIDGEAVSAKLTIGAGKTAETFEWDMSPEAPESLRSGPEQFRMYLARMLAPSAPAPAKSRAARGSRPAPADSGEISAVRDWMAKNGHDSSTVRAWAVEHGFEVKTGRLPNEPQMAYAKAHGYRPATAAAPSPSPSPAAPAAPSPADAAKAPATATA